MHLDSIGDVIGVRDVEVVSAEGHAGKVSVIIGAPRPFEDATGYYCPFQIVGLASADVKYAAGIDAIQALQLVMPMIGATLQFLIQNSDSRLRWDGGKEGDFGFPSNM